MSENNYMNGSGAHPSTKAAGSVQLPRLGGSRPHTVRDNASVRPSTAPSNAEYTDGILSPHSRHVHAVSMALNRDKELLAEEWHHLLCLLDPSNPEYVETPIGKQLDPYNMAYAILLIKEGMYKNGTDEEGAAVTMEMLDALLGGAITVWREQGKLRPDSVSPNFYQMTNTEKIQLLEKIYGTGKKKGRGRSRLYDRMNYGRQFDFMYDPVSYADDQEPSEECVPPKPKPLPPKPKPKPEPKPAPKPAPAPKPPPKPILKDMSVQAVALTKDAPTQYDPPDPPELPSPSTELNGLSPEQLAAFLDAIKAARSNMESAADELLKKILAAAAASDKNASPPLPEDVQAALDRMNNIRALLEDVQNRMQGRLEISTIDAEGCLVQDGSASSPGDAGPGSDTGSSKSLGILRILAEAGKELFRGDDSAASTSPLPSLHHLVQEISAAGDRLVAGVADACDAICGPGDKEALGLGCPLLSLFMLNDVLPTAASQLQHLLSTLSGMLELADRMMSMVPKSGEASSPATALVNALKVVVAELCAQVVSGVDGLLSGLQSITKGIHNPDEAAATMKEHLKGVFVQLHGITLAMLAGAGAVLEALMLNGQPGAMKAAGSITSSGLEADAGGENITAQQAEDAVMLHLAATLPVMQGYMANMDACMLLLLKALNDAWNAAREQASTEFSTGKSVADLEDEIAKLLKRIEAMQIPKETFDVEVAVDIPDPRILVLEGQLAMKERSLPPLPPAPSGPSIEEMEELKKKLAEAEAKYQELLNRPAPPVAKLLLIALPPPVAKYQELLNRPAPPVAKLQHNPWLVLGQPLPLALVNLRL
eukprot:gene10215-8131_t